MGFGQYVFLTSKISAAFVHFVLFCAASLWIKVSIFVSSLGLRVLAFLLLSKSRNLVFGCFCISCHLLIASAYSHFMAVIRDFNFYIHILVSIMPVVLHMALDIFHNFSSDKKQCYKQASQLANLFSFERQVRK